MRRAALVIVSLAALAGVGLARRNLRAERPDSTVYVTTPPPSTSPAPVAGHDALARRGEIDALLRAPRPLEALEAAWSANADRALREQILIDAARLGSAEAAQWLAAIATTDERLGARAGAALGSIANAAAAPALLALAEQEGPTIVRANAARALASSGSHAEAPGLVKLVEDGTAPQRVRQEAALSLARIGDDASVAGLARALESLSSRDDTDAVQLRISIVQALGGIGTPAARAALAHHRDQALPPIERVFVERALTARSRSASPAP